MHYGVQLSIHMTDAGRVKMAHLIPASSAGIMEDRVACQAQVCQSWQPVEAVHIAPPAQLVVAQQDGVQMLKCIGACKQNTTEPMGGMTQPDS